MSPSCCSKRKVNELLERRGSFFDGEAYVGDKGIEQCQQAANPRRAIAGSSRFCSLRAETSGRGPQGPGWQARRNPKAIDEKGGAPYPTVRRNPRTLRPSRLQHPLPPRAPAVEAPPSPA